METNYEHALKKRGGAALFLVALAMAFGLLLGTSTPAWAYTVDEPPETSVTLDKQNLNKNYQKISVSPITLYETEEQDEGADLRLFKMFNGSTRITADSGKIISKIEITKSTRHPDNFLLGNLSFSSGSASINDAGNVITVTGINNSSVNININNVNIFHYISIVVYYKDPIRVAEVTLNKSAVDLTRGGTETLTAEVQPENATYPTVTWSSSDSKVATVDNTGKISAAGVGTATITATADGKSATCTVTVTYTPEDVMAMINNLPAAANVKTSDDAAIKAARAAYNSLSDTNKAKVTNETKLKAAEAALPKAYFAEHKAAQKAAADAKAQAGDSDAAKALITAAKSAIDKLAYDESKSLDDNRAAVTAIVTKLNTDIADQRAADVVITQIAALPSADAVTTNDRTAIEGARAAYTNLNDARKARVPAATLKKLTDAEAALKEAIDTAAAQAVIEQIAALPSTESVIADNKAAIEEVRAAYDALTDSQKAKVPASTLKRLTDAEVAVAAAVVLDKIDALPSARNVTTEDKQDIEAARTAYDALTDEQKAWISSADIKRLTDAKDALAAAEAMALINNLPDASGVETGNQEAIEAAREAYDKLTDEQKAWITEGTLEKLTGVEAALKEVVDTAAADAAIAQITDLPTEENVAGTDESDIEAARKAYNDLTEDQKAKVPEDILQRLTAAEDALPVAKALEAINQLPATGGVTAESKDDIEAARKAYNDLTDEQKQKIPAYTLKKLTDAEEELPVATATAPIDSLPPAGEVTADDKDAIEAARAAYDALSDEEKAKVPAETLNKLLAAEAALKKVEEGLTPDYVNGLINKLPATDDVTTLSRDDVAAARAAYDALTPEQKDELPEGTLQKLTAAEEKLAGIDTAAAIEVGTQVNDLPETDKVSGSDNDKKAIDEARAAYDVLTPDQKAKLPEGTLEQLQAAEEAWVNAYNDEQKGVADDKGKEGDSQAAQALITAAKAAIDNILYDTNGSLDEHKAAVDAIIAKLQTDLEDQRTADGAAGTINGLPTTADITTNNKDDIKEARKAYDALTPEQKAKLPEGTLEKLTAAETAWAGAYNEEQKGAAEDKGKEGDSQAAQALITAAQEAINEISYDPDKGVDAYKEAVDAIVAKLQTDLEDQRAADTASGKISGLPAAVDVTANNEEAINAARDAYEALSDEQKAKVPADVLKQLEAAEAAVPVAKTKDLIDKLPAAGDVKTTDKEAIENARKAYDALTPEQKAKVPASVLKKLTEAEEALPVAAAKDPIGALPNASDVTADDQDTIEAARAAYDALTPEQKADVPEATIKKLAEAEAALKKAKGELTPEYVSGLLNALPDPASVKPSDRDAIVAARAAFDALDEEEKSKVTNSINLESAESVLDEKNRSAAEHAASQVDGLPPVNQITMGSKEAIEQARKDYDALTADQKAKLPAGTLEKLEAAEAALKDAVDTKAADDAKDQITNLPTENVTTESKEAIENARKAYDALTPDQKAKLPEGTLEKLEAAEAALKDAEDTAAAENASDKVADLPSASKVTPDSEEAIKAAREAYDKLTDDQKAKLPEGTLEKLKAAEDALEAAKSKNQISSLPAADDVTTADKAAIEDARKAYDALTDEQKARVPSAFVEKLKAAEKALEEAESKEAEQAAVDNAIDKISSLPAASKVKASDKAAIEAARKAYEALTPEQKAKVPAETLKKLKDAEAALAKTVAVSITKVTAANATYAGGTWPVKPNLTVTDANGKTVPVSGYTATWTYSTGYGKQPAANGKFVGSAKVTVTGKGSYKGSATTTFKVTTVADTKTVGATLTERTVTAIEKLKSGTAKVGQTSSSSMSTIAKPQDKTMTVKWAGVSGATNYLVGYKRPTDKKWSYVVTGGKTNYTFSNMKTGNLMEFRVAVYDAKKFARGEWTRINYRFYREMVSLKAKAGAGKIDLSWGKVSGATGYQVLIATKKDMSDAKIATVQGGSTLKKTLKTYDKKALVKGKTYYVKVRPIKSANNANGKTNTYIGIQSLVRECKVTGGTKALKS